MRPWPPYRSQSADYLLPLAQQPASKRLTIESSVFDPILRPRIKRKNALSLDSGNSTVLIDIRKRYGLRFRRNGERTDLKFPDVRDGVTTVEEDRSRVSLWGRGFEVPFVCRGRVEIGDGVGFVGSDEFDEPDGVVAIYPSS